DVPLKETIDVLCKTKNEGKTRHIGVANFTVALVEEAVKISIEPLVTNQIEVHPFIDRSKAIDASRRHGLSITAYCPIARGAGARRGGTGGHGHGAGQELRPGVAALPGAAGDHPDSAHRQSAAHGRQSGSVRLLAL